MRGPDADFMAYAESLRRRSLEVGVHPIGVDDALVLYALVFAYAARKRDVLALDLGAGIGYSTAWMARALEEGCRGRCTLVAVEREPRRASMLAENLRGLGLRRVEYRVVEGDAEAYLGGLAGCTVDIAFVDVRKESYPRIMLALADKLVSGGIAIFHNALVPSPPPELYDLASAGPWASTVVPTGLGMLVAVKTRGCG